MIRTNHMVTLGELDTAECLGACPVIIAKMRRYPVSWAEVIDRQSAWLLFNAVELLTPEQLDTCAEVDPHNAIRCAAKLLTPERLDSCAKNVPYAVIRYAASLVTPERLDACAEVDPSGAMYYAADLLTPERRAKCIAKQKA